MQGKTTIEGAPQSKQADVYRRIARRIADHTESKVPTPLDQQQLREWSSTWADHLIAIEQQTQRLAS